MTQVVIVAHAPLASALLQVAQHTFAEAAQSWLAVDVRADDLPDAVAQRLLDATPPGPTLVLVDVPGATPFNGVQRARRQRPSPDWAVVSGVNVPMLWRTLCYADAPPFELAERALAGAQKCTALQAADAGDTCACNVAATRCA